MSLLSSARMQSPDDDFDLDSPGPFFSCRPLLLPENPMPLPPECTYESEQAMINSIQAFASEHYYAFRIGRSKLKGKKRKVILYECDRAGKPPPEGHPEHSVHMRVQNTTTQKTNC
jgi:hypothetical protein